MVVGQIQFEIQFVKEAILQDPRAETRPMMKLQTTESIPTSTYLDQIVTRLPIQRGEQLMELGCGRAETTRQLANRFPELSIVATEVDSVQHQRNLASADLPNVTFRMGGAESIDAPDSSVHYVVMLKSLHHVPIDSMSTALAEIRRVIRPGGWALIGEPIYGGAFNEILKLFNDEERVREAAFAAVCTAVQSGQFELVDQIFFQARMAFSRFDEFEQRVMGATHSSYSIDDSLHAQIESAYTQAAQPDGRVEFLTPQRVDLIRRPLD